MILHYEHSTRTAAGLFAAQRRVSALSIRNRDEKQEVAVRGPHKLLSRQQAMTEKHALSRMVRSSHLEQNRV